MFARQRQRYRAAVFAALGSSPDTAIAVAREAGGLALVAVDGPWEPTFATLVVGDDRAALAAVATGGLYAVTVRRMRHQRRFWPADTVSPGVTAVFPMVRRAGLSHEQADSHWRDTHAPLALRHHPGLWHYHQISVDAVLDGPDYDGFALCAFASEQERAERFYGDDDDRAVIAADVATFSDMRNSPRHVRMVEWRFGAD